MILLDTNVVIAVLNDRPTAVRPRLRAALEAGEELGLSSVVVFELRYGAGRSARPAENHARIDDLLAGPLQVLELSAQDAAEAGTVRARARGPRNPHRPLRRADRRPGPRAGRPPGHRQPARVREGRRAGGRELDLTTRSGRAGHPGGLPIRVSTDARREGPRWPQPAR